MRLDFDYPLFAYSSDGSKVTLPTDLKQLDGYQSKESDSNLAAHMDPPLSRKISKGHKMSLHLVGGDLTARFSFHIVDEAEDELISELSEFVHGQILDGFGEGCYYLPHKTKIRQISYLAFPSAPDLAVPERVNDGKKIRHPAPSKRLIWAAEDGDLDQIRSAVSGGQKLDVKGQWSTTPLSIAVRNKHVECVRVLLEGGAHIALPLYDTVESTCPVQQNAMTGTYLLDWKKKAGLITQCAGHL